MSGVITLYYQEEFIKSKKYYFEKELNEIQEQWRKMYGKKYAEATICIKPHRRKSRISKYGYDSKR